MDEQTAWARLKNRTLVPKEQPKQLYLSGNTKTGHSINVPIALTCHPTKACIRFCYGRSGPIAFTPAIVRQAQNWLRFEALEKASLREVEREADRIRGAMLYVGQDFLRVFGVGDLQLGSVRFINVLAERHPDLILWVSTRRIDLASKLAYQMNIQLMFSTDVTTRSRDAAAMLKLVSARPTSAFMSFVQQSEGEEPRFGTSNVPLVIFPQHKAAGRRAPWTAKRRHPDIRWCPAGVAGDSGLPHKNACASCRHCIDPSVRAVIEQKIRRQR